MKEYTLQDKPLYWWRLTDNNCVIKTTIPNWNLVSWGPGRGSHYEFRTEYNTKGYVNSNDLDVFRHNRYYSFDGDDEKAMQAIIQYYITRVQRAQNEMTTTMKKLEDIKKQNSYEDGDED